MPSLVQLFRQEERIGVQPVRSKQFRTDRDDFSFHRFDYPSSGKPRTSQSSVKSAPVVARMARPEGCSARPTSPEPLSTTSACALRRDANDAATPAVAKRLHRDFRRDRTPALAAGRVRERTSLTSPPCVMRYTRSIAGSGRAGHVQVAARMKRQVIRRDRRLHRGEHKNFAARADFENRSAAVADVKILVAGRTRCPWRRPCLRSTARCGRRA